MGRNKPTFKSNRQRIVVDKEPVPKSDIDLGLDTLARAGRYQGLPLGHLPVVKELREGGDRGEDPLNDPDQLDPTDPRYWDGMILTREPGHDIQSPQVALPPAALDIESHPLAPSNSQPASQ
jgi:hypothetical protein